MSESCKISFFSEKDEIPACQLLFVGENTKNIEKVTAVSSNKAMLTAQDKDGWTALMYSADSGRTDIVEAILSVKEILLR